MMKKKVISFLLTIVLVSGGIFAVPVRAADTAVQETASVRDDAITAEQSGDEEVAEVVSLQEEANAFQSEDMSVQEEETEAFESEEAVPAQENLHDEQEDPLDEEAAEEAEEIEAAQETRVEAKESSEQSTGQKEAAADTEAGLELEEGILDSENEEASGDVIDSGECGEKAVWTLTESDSDLLLTISGSGELMGSGKWNDYKTSITRVVIDTGITGIGWNSFSGCINITSFEIPDSVSEIASYAFENCSSLTSISFPGVVTSIGSSAFSGCVNLVSAEFQDGLEKIGTYAFEKCSSLASIRLPESVKTIGGTAFKGCSSLTSIEIPGKVTAIEGSTFFDCTSLSSVTIGDSVESIGDWAFYNCSCLTDIELNDGMKRIGRNSFAGCTELENVFIPDTVNSISAASFDGFTGTLKVYSGSYAETFAKEQGYKYKAICKVHVWSDEWVVVKEPAYNEPGIREHACEICGETEQEEIPALPAKSIEDLKIRGIVDKTHTGKAVTQTLRVIDGDLTLTEGTDYSLTYENNTNIGLASVTITGEGAYTGSVIMAFEILPAAPKTVRATNVVSGMKLRWDKVEGATSYYVYRNNKFLFRTSWLEATDKDDEVKNSNGVKFTYKVVASAKIDGVEYDSNVFRTTTYYRLIPVGIKSVKNTAPGKMTVSYDKNAKSTGYVVRYGLKSDMSDAKVITVSGAGTLSRTFSGLKKGKTYYVQVRTYLLEGGTRYYSGYCTTRTVKITK